MIITTICNYYKLDKPALLDKSRKRNLVEARQMAFLLFREFTELSLSQIGQKFNRDHATVLYGVRKITDLIDTEKSLFTKHIMLKNMYLGLKKNKILIHLEQLIKL